MKITVLGCCSGTEPMPGCHQTSVAVETGGRLYFIDAGENAGYASYLGGITPADFPTCCGISASCAPSIRISPPAWRAM